MKSTLEKLTDTADDAAFVAKLSAQAKTIEKYIIKALGDYLHAHTGEVIDIGGNASVTFLQALQAASINSLKSYTSRCLEFALLNKCNHEKEILEGILMCFMSARDSAAHYVDELVRDGVVPPDHTAVRYDSGENTIISREDTWKK